LKHILPLSGAVLALLVGSISSYGEFISGADFSHLAFFEARGISYKDNGQTQDALAILKNHGLNCVRLRLFTSSAAQAQADPYNYINNLDYTVPLAVRVKNAGLKFLLDFHYSDTWADPAHQATPSAWTNLTFTELVAQMRSYNSNCIAAFNAAGAMPDYVQIGNEITPGLLWPTGHVTGNTNTSWSNLGQLMKAAINGIKDAAGTNQPKIIIHIDRGGDWNTTLWFFNNLVHQQVQFDMIGQSYYPFWHGSLTNLSICLSNTARLYGKPVLVMETDFPWSGTTNIYNIPPTTNGQVQFMTALAQIVKGLTNNLGAGIVWWGSEYQRLNSYNLAGFDKRSFFGSDGNALPVVDSFGELVVPLLLDARLSGNDLVVQWPLSGAGMTLTTTSNLRASAAWSLVTNSIQTTGTTFNVVLPRDPGQSRFYRLQSN
jgi:arabinogalactan endo-1,4-beta-galactosidase